jgi:hypothetical protein
MTLSPFRCGDRGGFETDIASPHDQQVLARIQPRGKGVDIGEIANGEDAGEILAHASRQAARMGPGRQRELGIGEMRPVGQSDAMLPRRDLRHGCGEPELDVLLVIPARGPDQEALDVELAGHVFLRQRRALKGA